MLERITEWKYVLKLPEMKIPAYFFINEFLLKFIEEEAIKQARNVAMLPSLVKGVMIMSDVHTGYGFPIGGVAASRYEEGIISPGGIGFDINCGVRTLLTDLTLHEIKEKRRQLIEELYKNIPSGLGEGGYIRLSKEEMIEVMEKGSKWAIEKGYGEKDDIIHTEEEGSMRTDPSFVSDRAISRGKNQLGTLGSGNHFLEIQKIEGIYDREVAEKYGLREGMITVMIHTGSRGLGHQVATDFLRIMDKKINIKNLPDRELIYAPISSEIGYQYYESMKAAANYAWTNRQIITHFVRKSIKKVYGEKEIKQLYDVAHNIAKIEKHNVDGEYMKLIVHRKGATRAFPKHSDLNVYNDVGQPVIIPGSMGTSSYILVGNEAAMRETFGSTCHGAGRVMSRSKALKKFTKEDVLKTLEERDILLKAGSRKGIIEEGPQVYKDIDEVIKVVVNAGIARIVAKMKPLLVIKG